MTDFCSKTANIWQIVGYIVLILKIVVPIIIIILGIIDLSKAVISSEDKVIKSSITSLVKRIIAGVAIFFVPTIINYAFSLVGSFVKDVNDNHMKCVTCITDPGSCDTSYQGEIFDI